MTNAVAAITARQAQACWSGLGKADRLLLLRDMGIHLRPDLLDGKVAPELVHENEFTKLSLALQNELLFAVGESGEKFDLTKYQRTQEVLKELEKTSGGNTDATL